jgi:RNA 3'-terminal phosphate cyclase (ATP)
LIEIDGSTHSGSGTILRYAVALATLMGEPLQMVHIRAKRPKPGLRPQHVQALRACCALSGGRLRGDEVGSDTISYHPGGILDGGDFSWDIGTAGSTTMLALTVIPLALFARRSCSFLMQGGLFQDFAPGAFYTQQVFLPIVRAMGADIELEILRPGYVPKGHGRLSVKVKVLKQPLKSVELPRQGTVNVFRAIALASHLEKEKVGQRMATHCLGLLKQRGHEAQVQIIQDTTAVQKGAAMLLWAETDTGCLLGADRAGKRGTSSERVSEFVVNTLIEDLQTGATTDRYLADQLILFAALAEGRTSYFIPRVTDHVRSNLWLVEKILGAGIALKGNQVLIDGIGLSPPGVG